MPNVVSKEVDVKATLAKVKLGEADAAVVYHSDVVAAKAPSRVSRSSRRTNTSLDYPVITLSDDAATRAFVAYVLSERASDAAVLRLRRAVTAALSAPRQET